MLNFEEDFTPAVQPAIDVPAFLRKESAPAGADVADAPAPQTRRVQAADKRVINGATDVDSRPFMTNGRGE